MTAHITVGLGFGDESKGATVDHLCRTLKAKLVVRYSGGAQAGHNVVLPDGRRHTFSQFGAGTLAGASTFLGPAVIIEPLAMRREAESLAVNFGFTLEKLQDLILVHPAALVSTPVHIAVNRLREAKNHHGTCGLGIGETRHYWLKHGGDAITAGDLYGNYGKSTTTILDKLELLRQRMLLEFPDSPEIRNFSPSYYLGECDRFKFKTDRYPHTDFSAHGRNAPVVFEGAQGLLIDETVGFHPHTTWSDVTVRHALELCARWGWEVASVIGCTRTYLTRHGNGPLPNAYDAPLEDPGNKPNQWQGVIRHAPLDIPLLKHAIQNAGAPLSGLSVSHVDQLNKGKICTHRDNLWLSGGTLEHTDDIVHYLASVAPVTIIGSGPTHENRLMCVPFRIKAA